jgi:hypothetical protein
MVLDNEINKLNDFNLGIVGLPMAIADTENGFVIYAKDKVNTDKSFVVNFTKTGAKKWTRIVMDNGNEPMEIKNQISFHDSRGNIAFGMSAMHKPHNGQLVVGRNRIFLIFAHYNNFKAGEGAIENHTGDTLLTFDMDGNNILLGSSWNTSHSLTQRAVYDGLQFVTSSLGDAYPQQIEFTKNNGKYANNYIDGKTKTNNRYDFVSNDTVIPGTIPGNGMGLACGKLGGLHVFTLGDFKNYGQVYSRIPCTVSFGSIEPNTVDESAIVYFDRDLNFISKKKFMTAKNVNIIKSAKYGKNIFVLFSESSRYSSSKYEPNDYDIKNDKCKMLLLKDGFIGSQSSKIIDLDKYIVNNDNPITLSDGNVAWSFVGNDDVLKVYTLKKPNSTEPSPGPITGCINPTNCNIEGGDENEDDNGDDNGNEDENEDDNVDDDDNGDENNNDDDVNEDNEVEDDNVDDNVDENEDNNDEEDDVNEDNDEEEENNNGDNDEENEDENDNENEDENDNENDNDNNDDNNDHTHPHTHDDRPSGDGIGFDGGHGGDGGDGTGFGDGGNGGLGGDGFGNGDGGWGGDGGKGGNGDGDGGHGGDGGNGGHAGSSGHGGEGGYGGDGGSGGNGGHGGHGGNGGNGSNDINDDKDDQNNDTRNTQINTSSDPAVSQNKGHTHNQMIVKVLMINLLMVFFIK